MLNLYFFKISPLFLQNVMTFNTKNIENLLFTYLSFFVCLKSFHVSATKAKNKYKGRHQGLRYRIDHDEYERKFVIYIENDEGQIDYERKGKVIELHDIYIPERYSGQGFGCMLAKVYLIR